MTAAVDGACLKKVNQSYFIGAVMRTSLRGSDDFNISVLTEGNNLPCFARLNCVRRPHGSMRTHHGILQQFVLEQTALVSVARKNSFTFGVSNHEGGVF